MPEQNTQPLIHIKREKFNTLWEKGITLFFFNKEKEWDRDLKENVMVWKPENAAILNPIRDEYALRGKNGIAFAFATPAITRESASDQSIVTSVLQEFDHTNYSHVRAVFLLHLHRRYNQEDKFACRELLWFLNNYYLDYDLLVRILESFDAQSIRPFFLKDLQHYAQFLSIPKQNLIGRILSKFGTQYTVYTPASLLEAIQIVDPAFDAYSEWKYSVFHLVNKATIVPKGDGNAHSYDVLQDDNITNIFLKIRRWLVDEEYRFEEWDYLLNLLRLFTPNCQLQILKRYFLAVLKKQTTFDISYLQCFKDNRHDYLAIYYHSLFRASKPVQIGLQLICDNIITYLNSGGSALQTVNGTLDMAFYNCNINSPSVDFQLENIIPVCNGGAVPRVDFFQGFICYQVAYSINDELLNNEQFIRTLAVELLDRYASRIQGVNCITYGDNFLPCEKAKESPSDCIKCDQYRTHLDRWNFRNSQDVCDIVRLFVTTEIKPDQNITIDISDINPNNSRIKENISDYIYRFTSKVQGYGSFLSGLTFDQSIGYEIRNFLEKFLNPVWMSVEPRNNAYIGLGLLAPKIGLTMKDYGPNQEGDDTVKKKESEYIKPIISSILQSMLGTQPNNEGKFFLPYNLGTLRTIKATFYTKKPSTNGQGYTEKDLVFLHKAHSFYRSYCAPEYKDDINAATNLPFFWCRGRECYMNALSEQTLDTCKDWKSFNLLHMLQILGHNQVTETAAGFEASKIIRDFIGMVNKASQIFHRVVCRECGHIMFPSYRVAYNQYNKFQCFNPLCSACGHKVYLNQCHNCKRGIIDSRDTKKCTNGWYICPTCLSCCTDDQIERQANKFIVRGNIVPEYIQRTRGFGHNDKGKYFCPDCGEELRTLYDPERNMMYIFCPSCRKYYDNAQQWIVLNR